MVLFFYLIDISKAFIYDIYMRHLRRAIVSRKCVPFNAIFSITPMGCNTLSLFIIASKKTRTNNQAKR